MKRYLTLFALLGLSAFVSANTKDYQPQNKIEFRTLAAQAHSYAQPITLFDCKTNKKQHLELLWSGANFDFFRQGKIEYEAERDLAYLHEYANGTQLMVPHNGKWYLFEETQATTGVTHVELVVRNAKTGRVLEYQECESDAVSLIPLISTDEVKPIPDDLAEWLFEVSNKYVP